jgi:hypothetical protein
LREFKINIVLNARLRFDGSYSAKDISASLLVGENNHFADGNRGA